MSASTEQRNEPKKVYTRIKTKTLLDAMSNASQMARTNFKNRAEPLHDTYFFVYQTLQTFSSYVREGIIIMIPSDFSDTASCLDSLVPSLVYLATAAGRLGSDGRDGRDSRQLDADFFILATQVAAWFVQFAGWWRKFEGSIDERRKSNNLLAGTNSTKFKNF